MWHVSSRSGVATLLYTCYLLTYLHHFCQRASLRLMEKNRIYIGCSDVTESVVTIRLPRCGYNWAWCVELKGEDLWSCSRKFESVSLRKCPYDHWLTNKAYLSAITVPEFFRVLPTRWQRKPAGKLRNEITSLSLYVYSRYQSRCTRIHYFKEKRSFLLIGRAALFNLFPRPHT